MKTINTYISEKLIINKDTKYIPENCYIIIDLLKIKDQKVKDTITNWFTEYKIEDVVIHILVTNLFSFRKNIYNIQFDSGVNTDILKGKSFIADMDDGNFDIMKKIITSTANESEMKLLCKSEEDKIKLYGGTEYGIYIHQYNYQLIISKKIK